MYEIDVSRFNRHIVGKCYGWPARIKVPTSPLLHSPLIYGLQYAWLPDRFGSWQRYCEACLPGTSECGVGDQANHESGIADRVTGITIELKSTMGPRACCWYLAWVDACWLIIDCVPTNYLPTARSPSGEHLLKSIVDLASMNNKLSSCSKAYNIIHNCLPRHGPTIRNFGRSPCHHRGSGS